MDDPVDVSPTGRRVAWRLVAAIVVLGAALAGWILGTPDTDTTLPGQVGLYSDALARVPEAPPPTTATTTPPAQPAVAIEVDEPQVPPGTVLGSVAIPKLGVDVPLLEGIDLWVIDQGSGHWPGTPLPGERGNLVVGGHRTLYQRPFHDLDKLVAGDLVVFTDTAGATSTYAVRGVVIVPANAVAIVNQNEAHTATLFACHPKGSATHRIVAKLRLLDDQGMPVDAETALPPVDLGTGTGDHVMQIEPGMAPPPP